MSLRPSAPLSARELLERSKPELSATDNGIEKKVTNVANPVVAPSPASVAVAAAHPPAVPPPVAKSKKKKKMGAKKKNPREMLPIRAPPPPPGMMASVSAGQRGPSEEETRTQQKRATASKYVAAIEPQVVDGKDCVIVGTSLKVCFTMLIGVRCVGCGFSRC
jgi:hypothetical protein